MANDYRHDYPYNYGALACMVRIFLNGGSDRKGLKLILDECETRLLTPIIGEPVDHERYPGEEYPEPEGDDEPA